MAGYQPELGKRTETFLVLRRKSGTRGRYYHEHTVELALETFLDCVYLKENLRPNTVSFVLIANGPSNYLPSKGKVQSSLIKVTFASVSIVLL